MHVGAVSVLEGEPFFDADGRFRIDEVRDLVLSRLPLMPRFRRRLMAVPYEQGRPIWVDDDRFDITYHVRHTALPRPGSWEQLVALDDARAGEPARPRAPAVGDLVRRRARRRQRRAPPEDAPRADRRRVGCRRRDAAARHARPTTRRRSSPSGRPSPRRAPSQLLLDTLRERLTEPAEIVRSIRSHAARPAPRARRGATSSRSR